MHIGLQNDRIWRNKQTTKWLDDHLGSYYFLTKLMGPTQQKMMTVPNPGAKEWPYLTRKHILKKKHTKNYPYKIHIPRQGKRHKNNYKMGSPVASWKKVLKRIIPRSPFQSCSLPQEMQGPDSCPLISRRSAYCGHHMLPSSNPPLRRSMASLHSQAMRIRKCQGEGLFLFYLNSLPYKMRGCWEESTKCLCLKK